MAQVSVDVDEAVSRELEKRQRKIDSLQRKLDSCERELKNLKAVMERLAELRRCVLDVGDYLDPYRFDDA